MMAATSPELMCLTCVQEVDVVLQAEEHRLPPHPNVVSSVRVYHGPVTVPQTGHKVIV